MDTALYVWSAVLSVATFILLILAIIAVVCIVKILKAVEHISEKAQESADAMTEVIEEVRDNVVSPSMVAAFISNYINKQASKRRKK
jgi:biopolymer transport protein ExbB/TolQ